MRRKAQWLHRYPHHTIENLRGNVQTRLKTIISNNYDGGIFAAAGLERLGASSVDYLTLDWMLPAPAQGAIVVLLHEDNLAMQEALLRLHDGNTYVETQVERAFLRALEGGCSAPIGAIAKFDGQQKIYFKGGIWSEDGKEERLINEVLTSLNDHTGEELAQKLMA